VVIIGEGFTGASEVTFGCKHKPASFIVDSDTPITAIVPAGAVGGRISVRTAGGYVISSEGFEVTT
jgi:hypothetical protein